MHGISDQVVCNLTAQPADLKNFAIGTDKFLKTTNVLTYLDGEVVPLEAQGEINIGQEEYKYKMPSSGRKTWKFLSNTPDMPGIKMERVAFQEAFNSIQRITALDIDYEFNPNLKTDFTIAFLKSIVPFNNKLSVLAHAFLYMNNSSKNGVIEFNDSDNSRWYFTPLGWSVPAHLVDPIHFHPGQTDARGDLIMRASQPAVHIGMHEIRHSVGGRHDLIHPESLLNPYAKDGWIGGKVNKDAFVWPKVDVDWWQFYYGKASVPDRIRERLARRRYRRSFYERYA